MLLEQYFQKKAGGVSMIQYREMTSISSVNCGSSEIKSLPAGSDFSDCEDDVSSIHLGAADQRDISEIEVNTESKIGSYLDQIASLRQQMASLRTQ